MASSKDYRCKSVAGSHKTILMKLTVKMDMMSILNKDKIMHENSLTLI